MTRLKVSDDFYLDEFIPKDLYTSTPEWKLKLLIDNRLINVAQFLRNKYGTMTINNWAINGNRNCSGFRYNAYECSRYYSLYSQHSHGRAIDIIFKEVVPAEVRASIKKSDALQNELFHLGARRIEADVPWLHIDLAPINKFTFFSA